MGSPGVGAATHLGCGPVMWSAVSGCAIHVGVRVSVPVWVSVAAAAMTTVRVLVTVAVCVVVAAHTTVYVRYRLGRSAAWAGVRSISPASQVRSMQYGSAYSAAISLPDRTRAYIDPA